MQDPSLYQQINPQFSEHEQLNCPRCDSTNTKFCYYNNYNLSQPRHYCKNCRRYWTKGGTLRNIPVGGGSRKAAKKTSSKKSINLPKSEPLEGAQVDQGRPIVSSVNDQFRSLIEGLNSNGLGKDPILSSNSSSDQNLVRNPVTEIQGGDKGGSFSGGDENGIGDSSYWGNGNGWPDLAIYTPGSTFQEKKSESF